MRLKSMSLKGFKSFPERTRLDFGPGVSVVVGPNGSGKSNVTDAVLWAMGEQSPLAIRGSSMQDVIFGGGHGVKARSSAEVEIVLDNSDGTVDLPLSEISILRRLDRSGEGEYRLNGARCRLTDVIEVLSDTGLGKETHSVISQGRVEAIVNSKPRDRRLLIEEAAGLGKHRKRRRRAQLKLERTQENLDRALDIEREARTRLRPLKRQAEAAELHERLESQMLEARLELARETLRGRRLELAGAETVVRGARERRAQIETALSGVSDRRAAAERALAERSEQREELARGVFAARTAHERVGMRREQTQATATVLAQRIARAETELHNLREILQSPEGEPHRDSEQRISELEAELSELQRGHQQEIELEITQLRTEHDAAGVLAAQLQERLQTAQAERERSDEHSDTARERVAEAERRLERTRREAAAVGARLAAVNQFLRGHTHPTGELSSQEALRPLSQELQVEPGYELALAAALGGRLDGVLVADIGQADTLLDRAGQDGAVALLADEDRAPASAAESGDPPIAGAEALLDLLSRTARRARARRPAARGRLGRRAPAGPAGGLQRHRRDPLGTGVVRCQRRSAPDQRGRLRARARPAQRARAADRRERASVQDEHAAREHLQAGAGRAQGRRPRARAEPTVTLRDTDRERTEADEAQRRAQWLIEQRRSCPNRAPDAVRRGAARGRAGRRAPPVGAHRARSAERRRRGERLRAHSTRATQRAAAALRTLHEALQARGEALGAILQTLEAELARRPRRRRGLAGELRACAAEEADIQTRCARGRGRDERRGRRAAAARPERRGRARARGDRRAPRAPGAGRREPEPLRARSRCVPCERAWSAWRAGASRSGRSTRWPQDEYPEALEHVEELEDAPRRPGDRAARAARRDPRHRPRRSRRPSRRPSGGRGRNFEELVGDVFPGGRGQLRLVSDELTPAPGARRPAAGGRAGEADPQAAEEREPEEQSADEAGRDRPAGRRDRGHARRQVDQAPVAAVRRREVDDRDRVPVRGVPRAPLPVLHPRRGRGRARRPNIDRFLTLLRRYARSRPVHRHHPPEAHDGGRRLALRRLDGRRRRLEGHLQASAAGGQVTAAEEDLEQVELAAQAV